MPKTLLGSFGWKSIFIAIQLVNQPINAEIKGIMINIKFILKPDDK
jgi:hypothetical protein